MMITVPSAFIPSLASTFASNLPPIIALEEESTFHHAAVSCGRQSDGSGGEAVVVIGLEVEQRGRIFYLWNRMAYHGQSESSGTW